MPKTKSCLLLILCHNLVLKFKIFHSCASEAPLLMRDIFLFYFEANSTFTPPALSMPQSVSQPLGDNSTQETQADVQDEEAKTAAVSLSTDAPVDSESRDIHSGNGADPLDDPDLKHKSEETQSEVKCVGEDQIEVEDTGKNEVSSICEN
jgi:hypothetical protein